MIRLEMSVLCHPDHARGHYRKGFVADILDNAYFWFFYFISGPREGGDGT
jgi:hypothetical protein